MSNQSINHALFYRAPKSWPESLPTCLPHVGKRKQKEVELKHKNRRANKSGERSRAMRSVGQIEKQTKIEDKSFWKGKFSAQNETVKKWWKVMVVCSKLDRRVQMKVAERGMNNSDEEFW